MKHYFFKTMAERGRNRLRPLAGQLLDDGEAVNQSWNVQSDKVIRSMYPIGTTFGSDTLYKRDSFYESGNIYPLGIRDDEYRSDRHRPSEELLRAYEEFLGLGVGSGGGSDYERDVPPDVETLYSKMRKNKKLSVPTIEKDGFYVDPEEWYLLIRNITNQVNTMLIGATGSGKTELVMLACKKLGIPCHVYDMGSMYDPVAGLLGVHRLQEGGVSVFDYAKFTKDITEPGVVVLDELSRAPVTTNNILFPVLDGRRCLPVEIAGGKDLRSVKVHDDCCFVATANVGSEYTGTMSMDRALVNRFFPMELRYMPADMEKRVLIERSNISAGPAQMLVSVANNVRSLYVKQEISCTLSTRETLMAADLVADGWPLLMAMEMVFLPLFEGTDTDGERGIIRKVLMSK